MYTKGNGQNKYILNELKKITSLAIKKVWVIKLSNKHQNTFERPYTKIETAITT